MPYTIPRAVSFKLSWGVLTSIIIPETFQFPSSLSLNHGMKLQKILKDLILWSKQINPYLLGNIINKSDKVFVSSKSFHIHGATNIRVYQLQLL